MRYAVGLFVALLLAPCVFAQCEEEQFVCPVCTPIVINLDNGDFPLTGADSPVFFDLAATGRPLHVGWTAAGADEAFLALDRNGDGRITDGTELFGSVTLLRDGSRAGNGFVALSDLDDNHDGVIDSRDAVWPQLLLWRDLNHDGISQANEITRLADSDVTAIDLDFHWSGRRDRWGNVFRYQSTVWMKSAGGQPTPRPLYDIFFVRIR